MIGRVSGTVLVKTPAAKTFAAVTVKQAVPLGSIIDTRRGAAALTSVAKPVGTPETAKLTGGLFKVTQPGAITQLQLVEKLAPCKSASKPRTRRLTGTGSRSFRIRGTDSDATGRGSKWTVQDSCAGTLTRGPATVTDLIKHKTVLLKAGRTYLARPKR